MNALELKIPPVAVVLIFAVAMWFASVQLPSLAFAWPWSTLIAVIVAVAGFVFGLTGVVAFRKAKTTANPTEPSATSTLVIWGVYRLSRNPMYVGLLLMLLGWAIFLAHLLAFAFLPLFVAYMNRFQISPEERALSSKFGEHFTSYQQATRRWLW
jgi:protein-S-isoprenylcysteine O-methyltransferase Ste14